LVLLLLVVLSLSGGNDTNGNNVIAAAGADVLIVPDAAAPIRSGAGGVAILTELASGVPGAKASALVSSLRPPPALFHPIATCQSQSVAALNQVT
jgi:hypothetical protein